MGSFGSGHYFNQERVARELRDTASVQPLGGLRSRVTSPHPYCPHSLSFVPFIRLFSTCPRVNFLGHKPPSDRSCGSSPPGRSLDRRRGKSWPLCPRLLCQRHLYLSQRGSKREENGTQRTSRETWQPQRQPLGPTTAFTASTCWRGPRGRRGGLSVSRDVE